MALGGPIASVILPMLCFAVVFTVTRGPSLANVFLRPVMQAWHVLRQMAVSLPHALAHADQLSGIVGIVAQGGSLVGASWISALQFAALISLNLVVVNLLPVPALDGGKVFLYLLEKIHPPLRRLHLPLAVAGWIFIIGLTVYVTVFDVGRLLGGNAGL
jgi:regulator of sigma E protease